MWDIARKLVPRQDGHRSSFCTGADVAATPRIADHACVQMLRYDDRCASTAWRDDAAPGNMVAVKSRVRATVIFMSVFVLLSAVVVFGANQGRDSGRSAEPSSSAKSSAARVVYHDAVVTGVQELPDVIGACPSQPITPRTDADPTAAATQAAVDYLTTTGQWRSAKVDVAYQVGSSGEGFGTLFASQIARWCGPAVANASFGVELTDTSGRWHGTDTHVGVVVSHFADGWAVWGAYH
jgi:hypothetical protein